MSIAVPLSLAAALAFALAVCVVALRRIGARVADAEARRDALVARADAARSALRDLQALPILVAPSVPEALPGEPPVGAAEPVRRARTDASDPRRGSRRATRPLRPASDSTLPARP